MPDPAILFERLDHAGRSYWLSRFLILRLLGFIYAVAFLAAAFQIVPLVGQDGLTPAVTFLNEVQSHFGSRAVAAKYLPSLFWLGISDRALVLTAWAGFALSIVVMAGYANAILMALLWITYMSFVHIGQIWYGYGWEIQLLETGFLGIFLCPLFDGRPFSRRPPPILVIWLYRWLGFRIMLGAGLIKLRGDPCWRDLTCLFYHFETQPIPNPLSRAMHFAQHWFLRFSTAWNHFIELIVPWFSFSRRTIRHVAGLLLISFQVILILTGNLSFLNYLTIVPFLALLDDTFLRHCLPGWLTRRMERAANEARPGRYQTGLTAALAVIIGFLSIAPVLNLLSGRQAMNDSFDPLDLVNTYGAFGSVGRERDEIIFEGTSDSTLSEQTEWKAYEFPCKPGDPARPPCVISPYQPRLDWQIWFAAMSTPDEYPWTIHFVWKLLHNDPATLSLLSANPFPDKPPRYIRARLFRYEFAPRGSSVWWNRRYLSDWLPPLSADSPELRRFLEAQGWKN